MRYIDLSVPLNEKTPVYPGDPKTKINKCGVLETNGYQDSYLCVGTHVGTHVDAPSHMLKGGKQLDEIEIGHFTGRGVYVPIGKEFDLTSIQRAVIQEDDIVLFHTGMSDIYHKREYYSNYPALSEDVAHYLVSKKVKMVGVDMCSVDHEPFPVHHIFLKNNILIIENLTNLATLNNKTFMVYAFPLRVSLDGSPTRVVAEIIEP